MPLDDPTLQFLAQPENLPLALDISKKVERLKVILHEQFWPAMTTELRERLHASEYADRWYLTGPEKGREMSQWAGVNLKPLPEKGQILVYPNLSQTTPQGEFHLTYGVHWSKHHQDHFDTEAVKTLIGRLNQQGFKTTAWWPGVIYLDIWLRRKKFLLGMANEEEAFIEKTADIIWDLFIDFEPFLTAANEELAQLTSNGK